MSEGAASAQSPAERKAEAEASSLKRESAPTSPTSIDDETAAALTLYNAYLIADREQQAHERALKKAEKAKDDAAAAVRELNDRKAPASETAAAEAKYRDAVEALQRLRDGDSAAPQDSDDEKAGDKAVGDDQGTASEESAPAEEDTPAEDTEDTPAEDTEDTTSKDNDSDEDATAEDTEDTTSKDNDSDEDATAEDTDSENAGEPVSVGVEASVGDDDLAGDEPAGVTG